MPTYVTGDMWTAYPTADLFCITTNSFITHDGRLVMGRGIARQARDRFPGLDTRFASAMKPRCGHLGRYGLIHDPRGTKLAAFQVKHHWSDMADLTLIAYSAQALARYIQNHPRGDKLIVHLNFPGIGNGRLNPTDVLPLLESLPANVYIWKSA